MSRFQERAQLSTGLPSVGEPGGHDDDVGRLRQARAAQAAEEIALGRPDRGGRVDPGPW